MSNIVVSEVNKLIKDIAVNATDSKPQQTFVIPSEIMKMIKITSLEDTTDYGNNIYRGKIINPYNQGGTPSTITIDVEMLNEYRYKLNDMALVVYSSGRWQGGISGGRFEADSNGPFYFSPDP